MGNTSSKGPFSIAMLVYRSVSLKSESKILHPPGKLMVRQLLSFWEGKFWGLNFRSVIEFPQACVQGTVDLCGNCM